MNRQFDTGHISDHRTGAGYRLNDRTTADAATVCPYCGDPPGCDFDVLHLGELVEFYAALACTSRITPDHCVVPGRSAIGVP